MKMAFLSTALPSLASPSAYPRPTDTDYAARALPTGRQFGGRGCPDRGFFVVNFLL